MKRKSRDGAAPLLLSSLNLVLRFACQEAYSCFFFNMQGAQGAQGYPGELGPQGPPGTSVSMNLCLACYFNLSFSQKPMELHKCNYLTLPDLIEI